MFKYWYEIMCYFDYINRYKKELTICELIRASILTVVALISIIFSCCALFSIIGIGIIYPMIHFGIIDIFDTKIILQIKEIAYVFYIIICIIVLFILYCKFKNYIEMVSYSGKEKNNIISIVYKSIKEKTCFIVDVSKYNE